MLHQHPAVLEGLARDRVAELRRSRWQNASMRREKRWHERATAARSGTGWLLVDLGLRLAVPRCGDNGRVIRGQ